MKNITIAMIIATAITVFYFAVVPVVGIIASEVYHQVTK